MCRPIRRAKMQRIPANSCKSASLGIFWITKRGVIGFCAPLDSDDVTDSGLFRELNITHFEAWPFFTESNLEDEFHYLRGRVVFDKENVRYKIIADPIIAGSQAARSAILGTFALPEDTVFETDYHYQSKVDSWLSCGLSCQRDGFSADAINVDCC